VLGAFERFTLDDAAGELLQHFAADLAAENEDIQRTFVPQFPGDQPELTILQIDTPLVLARILHQYHKFLIRWEIAVASFGQFQPTMAGNWHAFVNDPRFAEQVVQFKLPHNIDEMIAKV
jgi:hypothetical protein